MLTHNVSLELKSDHILAVLFNPGWVQTNMGGPNASITTGKSVESLINVISKLDETNTGLFYHYDGTPIKW